MEGGKGNKSSRKEGSGGDTPIKFEGVDLFIGKNYSYLLSVVICFRMDGSSCGAEPLIIVGRGRPEPIPPYYL